MNIPQQDGGELDPEKISFGLLQPTYAKQAESEIEFRKSVSDIVASLCFDKQRQIIAELREAANETSDGLVSVDSLAYKVQYDVLLNIIGKNILH